MQKRYFVASSLHSRDIYVMVPDGVRQETRQATENISPPPVSAAVEAGKVEVTNKQTAEDVWNYICYLACKTVSGRILAVLVLSSPLLMGLLQLYTTPLHTSYHHFLAHHFWFITGLMYLSTSVVMTGLLSLATLTTAERTVTISKECYRISGLTSFKSSWRDFSHLAEESNYFYFDGWRRAIQIPKRAFRSPAEAERFFEAAMVYWCEARGLPLPPPVPEIVGVWPPAPVVGNSAEPGDTS